MLATRAINRYQSVKVKTATPGQVLVMLYDGLFRFLTEAKRAMDQGDRARSGERLDKGMAIIAELVSTLRPEVAPELCDNLANVYHFCMDHLVQANIHQQSDGIDEVLRVLVPLREGFAQAVEQSTREPAAAGGAALREAV